MMQRFLACVLVFILCLSVLNMGARAGDTKIMIDAAQVAPGEQVTVKVSISGNTGLAYLKLKIAYDMDALTLVCAENTGLLAGTYTTSKTTDTNPYVLLWVAAGNSTGDGVIATLTFQVSDTATSGEYEITLTVAEGYDEAFNDISIGAVSGKITVTVPECDHSYGEWITVVEPTRTETGLQERTCEHCGHTEQRVLDAVGTVSGDANGDGVINTRDARLVLRYIAGLVDESGINTNVADYNGDGVVNTRDARAILRFIAGLT